jgi:voltage-gated potassium channel
VATPTDVPTPKGLDQLEPTERRRAILHSVLVSVGSTVGIVVVYFVVPGSGQRGSTLFLRIAIAVALLIVVSILSVRHVLRAELPVLRAVETLATVVTLAIVAFASAYLLLSSHDAAAFSEPLDRVDALYFSLTTSTTVGFGDINPRSDPARIGVMIQMVTNVVVVGVAARVLINTARRRIDR